MPPALPTASPPATLTDSASPPPTSTQHGLQDDDQPASGGVLATGSPGSPPQPRGGSDNGSTSSGGTRRGRPCYATRLNGRHYSSQEDSPGSRIDRYERAHTPSRKQAGGVLFKVVPTAQGKQARVSLDHFPNEVLTHVLSHLPPETLSSMSLVSHRFHKLVTTPAPWQTAFARYFRGGQSLEPAATADPAAVGDRAQRIYFSRLSALSSWRSEYILRTRLLRSLARGRTAVEAASRTAGVRYGGGAGVPPSTPAPAPALTFHSELDSPITHLHATWGVGLNKRLPMFIHGTVNQAVESPVHGVVSASDSANGQVGRWGLHDFQDFRHFAIHFPGERPYGAIPGTLVGMPNVMSVSQPYGKVYGEACPDGRLHFTSSSEPRGRFVPISSRRDYRRGIPDVCMHGCAVTAVWLAKSEAIVKATNGLFGFVAGFSNGVVAAYAMGGSRSNGRSYDKGEPTAKWIFCPGVPIIAICVDEHFNERRRALRRVWATVLNALGEVYYLTDVPASPDAGTGGKRSPEMLDRLAWQTGRSVAWTLVEPTRRSSAPDPFRTSPVDGSYTPRLSSDDAGLSEDQVAAEAKEVEEFLSYKPDHFHACCQGWDMRRRLLVDFAGDDHHHAGEVVFVLDTGLEAGGVGSVRRFARCKTEIRADVELEGWPTIQSTFTRPSLFGAGAGASSGPDTHASPTAPSLPQSRTSSQDDGADAKYREDWYVSQYSWGNLPHVRISAVASDDSDLAVLCVHEDPLLGMSGGSSASSPWASPMAPMAPVASPGSPSEMPGHRARLMGIGTTSGMIILWNMRAARPPSANVVNVVSPVRVIYTKSPQVASLAMTSLYVVHGGNEALVQAWDPLASTDEPIRTINARNLDRGARRLAQAEALVEGMGNYIGAGPIVLDPDPTVLRGVVSLGTTLKYWSYSSTGADAYKGRKRGQRRRRSDRGSAPTLTHKITSRGRGLIHDYINQERFEMEREGLARHREHERLSGRFGTTLLGTGATEDELIAYATLLSHETFSSDEVKRTAHERRRPRDSPSPPLTADARPGLGIGTATRAATGAATHDDDDLAEALRRSLLESEPQSPASRASDFDIPIRYAKSSRHGTPSKTVQAGGSRRPPTQTPSEAVDLSFVLQLSLAEAQSQTDASGYFPLLGPSPTPGSDDAAKGKRKAE